MAKKQTKIFVESGKFFFDAGTSTPFHYMPLRDFSMHLANHYSLFVALRLARKWKNEVYLRSSEISGWRERIGSSFIARTVSALPPAVFRFVLLNGLREIEREEIQYALQSRLESSWFFEVPRKPEPKDLADRLRFSPTKTFEDRLKPSHSASIEDQVTVVIDNTVGSVWDRGQTIDQVVIPGTPSWLVVRLLWLNSTAESVTCWSVLGECWEVTSASVFFTNLRDSGGNWFAVKLTQVDSDFFLPPHNSSVECWAVIGINNLDFNFTKFTGRFELQNCSNLA